MAFRPLGVYILTGSALYMQTKTTHHLTEMTSLATKSSSIIAIAAGETETATELQREAALDSEEGLEKQTESIELEAAAEREQAEATEEKLLAEKYRKEAEALHEKAIKDNSESESLFEESEGLEASSQQKNIEAGQNLADSETYQVQSEYEFDKAAVAEKLANEAEIRATKDEGIVIQKEASSAKDAESLVKTETGAAEDAEAIAACEAIPILNVVCGIAGAITEASLQSIAAVEAAKSAVDSITAATWSGKEREELLIASYKHAEAAKDAAEGSRYQSLSVEAGEKSVAQNAESASFHESGLLAQSDAEEKLAASEEEELKSKFDKEESSRHSAEAAEHQTVAIEEESAATSAQLESEERMGQSTAEEFEALSERIDADSKENEARMLLEQSIGHGMQALWYVTTSILMAAGTIYVVTIKAITKWIAPTAYAVWRGERNWTRHDLFRAGSEVLVHVCFILAVLVGVSSSFSNFHELPTWSRWKKLINLAVLVGLAESLLFHSLAEACCSQTKGHPIYVTAINSGLELIGKMMHIIPVFLIELLIVLTICGPGMFSNIPTNSYLVWSVTLPLALAHVWYFKLRPIQKDGCNDSNGISHRSSGWEEYTFVDGQEKCSSDSLIGTTVDKEYGSLEEVSLLTSAKQPGDGVHLAINSSSHDQVTSSDIFSMHGSFERLRKDWERLYFALHVKLDMLAFALMAMLLCNSSPVIKVLHPVAVKTFAVKTFAAFGSLLSLPTLIIGVFLATLFVHYVFVR